LSQEELLVQVVRQVDIEDRVAAQVLQLAAIEDRAVVPVVVKLVDTEDRVAAQVLQLAAIEDRAVVLVVVKLVDTEDRAVVLVVVKLVDTEDQVAAQAAANLAGIKDQADKVELLQQELVVGLQVDLTEAVVVEMPEGDLMNGTPEKEILTIIFSVNLSAREIVLSPEPQYLSRLKLWVLFR
jgi:hypothetical protein